MTKAERARSFSDYLQAEGYAATTDEDSDIVFKYEGAVYLVVLDDTDTGFFRIVFPNFWPIESESERVKVEKAALAATAGIKVAKVFPVSDNVWATIELFTTDIEQAKAVFKRSMLALRAAVNKFAQEMLN